MGGSTTQLSNRKFCLECSPIGQHNTRDITVPRVTKVVERTCNYCNKRKVRRHFYSRSGDRKHEVHSYCKECIRRISKETKAWAVQYKGGACIVCGYKRINEALEFHHRDPKKKDFAISDVRYAKTSKTISRITQELDKCDLLCSNCHREEHVRQKKIDGKGAAKIR